MKLTCEDFCQPKGDEKIVRCNCETREGLVFSAERTYYYKSSDRFYLVNDCKWRQWVNSKNRHQLRSSYNQINMEIEDFNRMISMIVEDIL